MLFPRAAEKARRDENRRNSRLQEERGVAGRGKASSEAQLGLPAWPGCEHKRDNSGDRRLWETPPCVCPPSARCPAVSDGRTVGAWTSPSSAIHSAALFIFNLLICITTSVEFALLRFLTSFQVL